MNLSHNKTYSQLNPLKSLIIGRPLALFNYQKFYFNYNNLIILL